MIMVQAFALNFSLNFLKNPLMTFRMKQSHMIGIPAVTALGAHPFHLLGPDHHHLAPPVVGDDGGSPPAELPAPSLIHVVQSLEPASSRMCTDTFLFL